MKILFICSEYVHPKQPLAGIFFQEQAHALRDAGVKTDVVFVEPRSLRTASVSGILQQHFQIVSSNEDGILVTRQLGWNPGIPRGFGGKIYSELTFRLAKYHIERYGTPDVIHVHCALWAGPAANKIKQMLGIPYVVTEHHSTVLVPQKGLAKKALRATYAGADRVISVGRHLASAMNNYVPGKEIDIVPNIVDSSFFAPLPLSCRSNTTGPRIVAVGTLDANKSHNVLLHAFAHVIRRLPSATLTIAGEGPRRSSLEQLAAGLNVRNRVKFLGLLTREGVRDLLRVSDILVLTSKYETFGVTLIEAGASGIPVIATACGGPDDIVTSNTGFLVKVNDVEAIAACIVTAWHKEWDPEAIREDVLNRYGREVVIRRLIEIYKAVKHRREL